MAKKFFLPLVLALIGLLLGPSLIPTPFEMRVVDEQTGVGVPVRVTADNGIDRDTPKALVGGMTGYLQLRRRTPSVSQDDYNTTP